jgi:hypothetical protein
MRLRAVASETVVKADCFSGSESAGHACLALGEAGDSVCSRWAEFEELENCKLVERPDESGGNQQAA